ncbi:MAG: hypothetical protein NTV52_21370, partial [Acidobacteria bacterium]|nr:hypothetical protein [Acidobacteriota bacterium]
PSVLRGLEGWSRRRLRSVIWKQWKRSRVRFGELRRRGVGTELAAQTVGSSRGPWRLANSPARDLSAPSTFGLISGQANNPRNIQLGLKYIF